MVVQRSAEAKAKGAQRRRTTGPTPHMPPGEDPVLDDRLHLLPPGAKLQKDYYNNRWRASYLTHSLS
eukprot:283179-Prorocentrum_lima.AAC.1